MLSKNTLIPGMYQVGLCVHVGSSLQWPTVMVTAATTTTNTTTTTTTTTTTATTTTTTTTGCQLH